jgi:peptide/nickel transport system permease protein
MIKLSGFQRYFLKRLGWYLLTFVVAISLNFILPRLGPSNPVDTIMQRVHTPGMTAKDYKKRYEEFMVKFGLMDKNGRKTSLISQFFTYVGTTLRGDLGVSFAKYPKTVWDILKNALPWSLGLQVPSIVLGYILGNILGALAAYKRGVYDRVFYPLSLFLMSIPYFCLGIVLVYVFGIAFEIFPPSGGYAMNLLPNFSLEYFGSVLYHYTLPFATMVLVFVGGQAIGMRSMSIYELGTDYVKYAKMLGVRERTIVGYVIRNAMLPQLTGLALALGFAIGGALLIEIVFSYPGVGLALYTAILEMDYPVIQAGVLIVTVSLLVMNFMIDILIGLLDPRVRIAHESREL